MKNTNEWLVDYILKYINDTQTFKQHFVHHKQKYSIKDLFLTLLYKLEHKTSYRETCKIKIKGVQQIKYGSLQYLGSWEYEKYNVFINNC